MFYHVCCFSFPLSFPLPSVLRYSFFFLFLFFLGVRERFVLRDREGLTRSERIWERRCQGAVGRSVGSLCVVFSGTGHERASTRLFDCIGHRRGWMAAVTFFSSYTFCHTCHHFFWISGPSTSPFSPYLAVGAGYWGDGADTLRSRFAIDGFGRRGEGEGSGKGGRPGSRGNRRKHHGHLGEKEGPNFLVTFATLAGHVSWVYVIFFLSTCLVRRGHGFI